MRVFSKIKRMRATRDDPYRVIPIPPRSVIRIAKGDRGNRGYDDKEIGRVFRIGYYGRRDGLDCIWLVNDDGEYEQTADHDLLFKYCDIIVLSEETDLYGKERPQLPPIRKADKLTSKRATGHKKKGTA